MRKLRVLLICAIGVALVARTLSGQSAAGTAQPTGPAVQAAGADMKVYAELGAALETGRFVDQGSEFKLDHPLALGPEKGNATIEFQVGTREGRPVFVPFIVNAATRDALEKEVASVLPKIKVKNPLIQMCPPDSEQLCVETLNGACVKYLCVPRKVR